MGLIVKGDNIPLSEVQKLKDGQVNKVIAKVTDPEIVKKLEELSKTKEMDEMQRAMLVTEITTMIQKQEEDNLKAIAELTNMIAIGLTGGMQ
ncbi:MAG: hypothetical protein SOR77_01610 [Peptoniphilus sp.]|uniref:hypothetical protein n=1 Tax=Peptoniphilus sp. TaxID=1971214 RepID=UPI002A7548B2|nr:hypothetical protein [Peptoniphilus sp.]MDY2986309.1 hypothetical protein [Peptoniphilus sp.]